MGPKTPKKRAYILSFWGTPSRTSLPIHTGEMLSNPYTQINDSPSPLLRHITLHFHSSFLRPQEYSHGPKLADLQLE